MVRINLPPDLEERLCQEAQRRGTTAEVLAIDAIRQAVAPSLGAGSPATDADKHPKSLYEFLMSISEPVDGPTESIAENHSKLFADILEDKWRRGKL